MPPDGSGLVVVSASTAIRHRSTPAMRLLLWILTLARLALIPVFLWTAWRAQEIGRAGGDPAVEHWSAVSIMVFMGLTDVVDGWMARRFDLATQAGAVLDASSDKLAQFAILIFLVVSEGPVFTPVPVWFLAVVFGCDLLGLVGWLFLRSRYGPIEVVHRFHGKAVTGLTALVLFLATVGLDEELLRPVLVVTAAGALMSIWAYWIEGRQRGRALIESGP